MVTLARVEFPAGYQATRGTCELLAQVVRDRYLHPRMRARARQLFAGLAPLDFAGELRAVWDHILGSVRYQRDPVGAEYITDPVTLDEQIDEGAAAEDCESMALYAATLFAAAGIVSRFEIQGRDPTRPQRFTHCALRVKDPRSSSWVSFDPVGAVEFPGAFDLGDTLHRPGDPIEWWDLDGRKVASMNPQDLFEQSDDGDSLLGCCLGDATADKIVGGITSGLIAAAPALGPYGAIAAGAGALTQGIYGMATGKPAPAPKVVAPPAALGTRRVPIARIAATATPQVVAKAPAPKPASSAGPLLGIGAGALLAKLLF